jgi:hypothetical protein
LLFIQCEECAGHFEKCCSVECREQTNASEKEKLILRKEAEFKFGNRNVYRKSYRLAKAVNEMQNVSVI